MSPEITHPSRVGFLGFLREFFLPGILLTVSLGKQVQLVSDMQQDSDSVQDHIMRLDFSCDLSSAFHVPLLPLIQSQGLSHTHKTYSLDTSSLHPLTIASVKSQNLQPGYLLSSSAHYSFSQITKPTAWIPPLFIRSL